MLYQSPYNEGFWFPEIDIPSLVLDENIKKASPAKPAIIDGYTGEVVFTYQSLRHDIVVFAGFLQRQLRIGHGDVVAYLSFNTTYYPVVIHGILAAGATASALNPAYKSEEIAHALKLARPKYAIIQSALVNDMNAAIRLLPDDQLKPKLFVLDGASTEYPHRDMHDILVHGSTNLLQRPRRSPEQVAQDLAFICFSSGTSGLVKGVRLTHRNVVANVFQQGYCLRDMYTPETIFTLAVPFFHVLGLAAFCCQYVSHGAPIVVFKKFELPQFLTSLSRDKVTHVNVVPPIALALLQSPLAAEADFSSVKCLMNAAAPLKQALADKLCKRMDCVLTQWYGMTEASPSVISQREGEANVPHTIGRLLPGMQMRLIDETDVPQGQPGELLLRGPNMMAGYVGPPEITDSAVLDGFLRTGDVGYVNEEGFVFLVDRVKELIKVKGNQVAPAELEAVLLSHPAVTDAAVCGVYLDDEATEYPIAYVSISKPATGNTMVALEIQAFVDGQVAHYKHLQGGVHVLEMISRK
ncbi:hypothetical protein BAUCODRAFT_149163 [Baudoinia panamericana UAMH 10762]|uniref:AMP-dependent synthetase/ligase domain-containing protein n=1 Tax=Baudoinia panamericana (strain UAMH 10762) TaxID=717646 RepID=M2MEW6_BAUPA|nr:uncharacterized protein BAUCODRAFT_149163 [Baudoinia panamericana UAMH 10762]EMC95141.1 hypothetical protein BAUCODRAFT_149163 [Baudoinia panamericana UAMH 10762]